MPDNYPKNMNEEKSVDKTPAPFEHAEARHEPRLAGDGTGHARSAEAAQVREAAEITEGREGELISSEVSIERRTRFSSSSQRTLVVVGAVALVAILALLFLWSRRDPASSVAVKTGGESGAVEEHSEEEGEVRLEAEALSSAGLEYEGVTQRPAVTLLRVTGAVEANPRQTQLVSSLVGGRVEAVNVAVGDRVGAGAILATISSPAIAEMHGKLREALARLDGAERNLRRIQQTENRVNILRAKAKLEEAETTLKRTRRLIEQGAGAGRDLVAAEASYKTAKADYDFQNNISLNRELQEAETEIRMARTEVSHLRSSLRALGSPLTEQGQADHSRNISLISLRAPASGLITERTVNTGAGVQVGQSLFTISNLSTVYIIANVPEAQVGSVHLGTLAEIRSTAPGGEGVLRGSISYIDPHLDEATRTALVRIEVANPGERLRAGVFVEVGFQTTTGEATGEELVVPSSAIQRVGDKSVVFIPKTDEPGAFETREIKVGGESAGYARVLSGLRVGERVVTKGSFILKTQLQKEEMGEHGH